MLEAVETNETLFLEVIEDEANREVAKGVLEANGNQVNLEDKKTVFALLTALAGFKLDNSRAEREFINPDGIHFQGLHFIDGSDYANFTEEYMLFLAKLGFGVRGDFEDWAGVNRNVNRHVHGNRWQIEGEINSFNIKRWVTRYTINGWPIG